MPSIKEKKVTSQVFHRSVICDCPVEYVFTFVVAVFQVQFMMVACHCIRQMFVPSSCAYPRGYAYWIGSYALFFLIMFGDFYRQAYQNTRKQQQQQQTLSKPETNGAITNGFKKVD